MYIKKETKKPVVDNSFAAGPVLITVEILSFCLNQASFTPNNEENLDHKGATFVPNRTLCPT